MCRRENAVKLELIHSMYMHVFVNEAPVRTPDINFLLFFQKCFRDRLFANKKLIIMLRTSKFGDIT